MFLTVLLLIQGYAVNDFKIELYLPYFVFYFFFQTELFSTSYNMLGIICIGQHWLCSWSGLHLEAGKQKLASWDAWLVGGSCLRHMAC